MTSDMLTDPCPNGVEDHPFWNTHSITLNMRDEDSRRWDELASREEPAMVTMLVYPSGAMRLLTIVPLPEKAVSGGLYIPGNYDSIDYEIDRLIVNASLARQEAMGNGLHPDEEAIHHMIIDATIDDLESYFIEFATDEVNIKEEEKIWGKDDALIDMALKSFAATNDIQRFRDALRHAFILAEEKLRSADDEEES